MKTLRETIRERDGISAGEFEDMLEDFAIMVAGGDDPEEALAEVFGIEPDFLFDDEIVTALGAGLARRTA